MIWKPSALIALVVLVLAAIPPVLLSQTSDGNWLDVLNEWQTGLGAYWGALFGLAAILIGALYNFALDRRRDDELREQESRGLASALLGEVITSRITCAAFVNTVTDLWNVEHEPEWFDEQIIATNYAPQITTPIYEASCGRLGLLGKEVAKEIVVIYSFLLDYQRIARKEQAATRGNHLRSMVGMAENVRDRLQELDETIDILDAYISGGYEMAAPVGLRVTEARGKRGEAMRAEKKKRTGR